MKPGWYFSVTCKNPRVPIAGVVGRSNASSVAGLRKIAEELNTRGILTARNGQWYPTTVRNLLARSGRLI